MAIAPMTGEEIIVKFRNMVNDQLDGAFEYQLLNDAKNDIEAEQAWEVLKYIDSSQTANVGDDLTVTHPLPSNFNYALGLWVGLDYSPYNLVPFDEQRTYRDVTRGFIINSAADTFALTGIQGTPGTIYLAHIKYSDDITAATTWSALPARFSDILALKMAQTYYAANAGEKARAWDDRWKAYFESMLNSMKKWDMNLKNRARQIGSGSVGYGAPDPRVAFY